MNTKGKSTPAEEFLLELKDFFIGNYNESKTNSLLITLVKAAKKWKKQQQKVAV